MFWTNDPRSIKLDEAACKGKCQIRLLSELKEYNEFGGLIEQFISNRIYNIEFVKMLILSEFGGLYLDCDFHYIKSTWLMHKTFDFYTGDNGRNAHSITMSNFGIRKDHPALLVWKQLLLEWYGYRPKLWGVREMLPMPIDFDSLH